MKTRVFYTIIFILLFVGFQNIGHAFDLDETIDDDIRKNYNPTKLVDDTAIKSSVKNKNIQTSVPEETLPELPSITKTTTTQKKQDVPTVKTTAPPKLPVYNAGNTKIRKGSSFDVVSQGAISDWQSKGSTVKFTTKKQISGRGYTLPAGTTFYGEILEVHQPQITCNGGLVVIRANTMVYKGQAVYIKAYITRANDKKIFLNNIKGKRTYLQTMYKKGNWGRSLFSRMLTLTINLGGSGSTILLSPFPLAYGTICLGANTLISPITAFFSKGGHVSIPAGKNFKIKLLEDVYI